MNDATRELSHLLGRLSIALRVQEEGDLELLQRFTTQRDEDAFAELVRRHGPLVLGVCRRMLRDRHAAEDAFQATFLLLARRAGRLGREGSLAGWLYGVAWRTARQALRDEERRRRREQQAGRGAAVSPDDLGWREVRELLDAELARLPERYRTPLLLCYLEDLPQAEAARRLGCSAGVLRGRVERGRALLRRRLEKQGLPAAPLLLGSAESVPPGLQTATVRAALAAATVASGVARWQVAVGLLASLVVGLGTSAASRLAVKPPPVEPVKARLAAPPTPPRQRVDRLGDPLPADALLRLGTLRHRYLGFGGKKQPLHDGRTLLFAPRGEEVFWLDTDTCRIRGSWALPNGLRTAGVSADGRLALLHDGKRSQQLWDLSRRNRVRTFQETGELGRDVSAVFSPDGRTVVTTMAVNDYPGLLRVWDVTTGRQRWQQGKLGLFGGWRMAGFLPDSRGLVLVGHQDAVVSLRDSATGKEQRSFSTVPRRSLFLSRLAPDGKTILFTTREKTVRSWDLSTGKERPPLLGHPGEVYALAVSSDSRTVVTGGRDPFILVWDWPAGKLRQRIELPGSRIATYLALSLDGKRLEVRQASRAAARFFDMASGKELPGPPEAHTGQVEGVAVTAAGRIVSGGTDDTLRIWDLRSGRQLRSQQTGLRVGVMAMSVSGDGQLVATGDVNIGQVKVFELPSCRLVRVIDTGGESVLAAHFCGPDRNLLLDVDDARAGRPPSRRFLALWDVERGREVRRPKPRPDGLAVSRDGRLRAGTSEGRLRVWDMVDDRERCVLPVEHGRAAALAPDGRTLACDAGGHVTLWELSSRKPRWQVERPPGRNYAAVLCFSRDGRWLAIGRGPRVELRDALSGRRVHTFAGHADAVMALAFAPDGRRLVSSSYDTTLLVWDVAGVLARQFRPRRPDDAALVAAWADLASSDASRVCRAMGLLIESPRRSVPLLRKHLRPSAVADRKRIARLVAELDSDDFATREKASRELEKLAEQAEDLLRKFLDAKPSAEARRRADRLLRRLAAPLGEPGRLRELRSLEVLERIGTPEAIRVLEALAGGASAAWLTHDARLAVERLRRR